MPGDTTEIAPAIENMKIVPMKQHIVIFSNDSK